MSIKKVATDAYLNKDDDGGLKKAYARTKESIFELFVVLLRENEFSLYYYACLSIIQFLQLIFFAFHPTVAGVWSDPDVTDVIYKVLGYFEIATYMEKTNWNTYIVCLYIIFGIVMAIIFGGIFLSYQISHSKLPHSWLIAILKNGLLLFSTILFLPFFQYFISVTACVKNENDISVHSYFSEVTCWHGAHIIHLVFVLLGTILLTGVSLVTSFVFFEYKSTSNDATARLSSRPNLLLNVFQILIIISETFFTEEVFVEIILALIFFGSVLIFMNFNLNSTYRQEFTIKLWSMLSSLILWTGIMVVFAKILEINIFSGSVIAWLFGGGFIILLVLTDRDHRVNLLLINTTKLSKSFKIQKQINYLLKLAQWELHDKTARTLLNGYIEIHKQICSRDDCPLLPGAMKANIFNKKLLDKNELFSERYSQVIHLVYKLYQDALKKFPMDNTLRISFSFFLLERMLNKQQALQELNMIDQKKLLWDEQFIIYRYRKIIEDDMAESQNEGQQGLDTVSEITFQSFYRQLQIDVERSSLLHMEFWSQLLEDNPDLAKLSDIGSKINSAAQSIEEAWTKLMKINPNNHTSLKLYGKYLIEIINDKESGNNFIERARKTTQAQQNTKRAIDETGENNEVSNHEATPMMWVSGEPERFSVITGVNLAAASLFGYNKPELLNKKLDILMPEPLTRVHDMFLQNYIKTGESSFVNKNKERLIFGKNKSNYIFPVYITLKVVESMNKGVQFVASFRIEKNFKNVAYVMTNSQGTIDSISSSCLSILGIDNKMITSTGMTNIEDYIPNIIKHQSGLFADSKNFTTITYTCPRGSEFISKTGEMTRQLNFKRIGFNYLDGKEKGAYYKIEYHHSHKRDIAPTHRSLLMPKISNFQFRHEKQIKALYVGEYVSHSAAELQLQSANTFNDEELDTWTNSVLETEQVKTEGEEHHQGQQNRRRREEEEEEKQVNFGLGIKTLRINNGRIQEIENEDSNKSDEDDENHNNSQNDDMGSSKPGKDHYVNMHSPSKRQEQEQPEDALTEEEGTKDFNVKSKKVLYSLVNDRTSSPAMQSLRFVANFFSIVLLVIAILDYVTIYNQYKAVQKRIDLLDNANSQLLDIMNSVTRVRDLSLLGSGVYPTSQLNEGQLRESLVEALDSAKAIKETLEDELSDGLSDAHMILLNEPVVHLTAYDGSITSKGLTQALEAWISLGYQLDSKALSAMTRTDPDVYFFVHNALNNLGAALEKNTEYYAIELNEKISSKDGTFLLLLIASILTILITMVFLYPIFYTIEKLRNEILLLFLDIPNRTVKNLYNKCETFLSNLQIGEEDDMLSEIEELELDKTQDDMNITTIIQKKKRRKYKNSGKGYQMFIIQFGIIIAISEAYFLFSFISTTLHKNNTKILAAEFNLTSSAEPFYTYLNTAERQLFWDSSSTIMSRDPYVVAKSNMKSAYNLYTEIVEVHAMNRDLHSDSYMAAFNQIMMDDPCKSLGSSVDQTDCQTFAALTIYKGVTVALARQLENLRTLLRCYANYTSGSDCSVITLPTNVSVSGVTATQNKILSMMATSQAQEISKMDRIYLQGSLRLLIDAFIEGFDQRFNSQLTTRLIVFIVFIVALVVVYGTIWQPTIQKINNDIWRTKLMLGMIPLSVIAKIKSIKSYIKRINTNRDITSL